MQTARTLFLVGAILVATAILYAIFFGDFFEEASILLPLPWFHLSMVDLYVGFFLFAGWIAYREQSVGRSIVWIVLLCVLGNVVSCLYALIAAIHARGDWTAFWMGRRRSAALRSG